MENPRGDPWSKKTFYQSPMKKIRFWTFLVFKNVQNVFFYGKVLEQNFLKVLVTEVRWICVSRPIKNALLPDFGVPKPPKNFGHFFGHS